jgi:2,4-dienoyl-CoA reductase-like NADH-dependent reductase (Old Yellow Enzyme family)
MTPPDPFAPARLGPVTLRNRIIKSATFEGYTPGALVSDQLIDFHVTVGHGGVGMTTVAYLAVAPEGRTQRDQIYWRPAALAGLRRLTDAVHETGARVSAQIGHAGPVANARSNGVPSIAPSRRFNPLAMAFDREATREDLERIIAAHAQAAAYAIEVGFDAVEIHLGHNYLPSAFLSPKINHRDDEWGGPLTARAEFPRRIAEAVHRTAVGQIAVLAKLNMSDGSPGGFALDESLAFARMLEADGHLDAIELTGGSSLVNPMYLFRGDVPLREFAAQQSPLVLRLGIRAFGRAVFKRYAYRPLYFLNLARQFRRELSMPLILLGGITDLHAIRTAMNEGFEYVAMARALLREPDLLLRIQRDASTRSLCNHCNRCLPTIYTGTHCPLATIAPVQRESTSDD